MILRFVPGCTREYEPELPTAVVALEDPIHEAHSEAVSGKISFERGTFVNLGGSHRDHRSTGTTPSRPSRCFAGSC